MAKAKPADEASTKSSNKSMRSLTSLKAAATSTLKTIKRKAIDIVSPKKKKKKSAVIPIEDESSDTSNADSLHPSRKALVIDVDEDNELGDSEDEDEPGKKDKDELGEYGHSNVAYGFTYLFDSLDDEIVDLTHLCFL